MTEAELAAIRPLYRYTITLLVDQIENKKKLVRIPTTESPRLSNIATARV